MHHTINSGNLKANNNDAEYVVGVVVAVLSIMIIAILLVLAVLLISFFWVKRHSRRGATQKQIIDNMVRCSFYLHYNIITGTTVNQNVNEFSPGNTMK